MLLITGVTGHTGRYFLKELIKNEYSGEIRCVVRDTSDTTLITNSGLNIETVTGDLNDEVFLNECMKGVHTVFHIVNIRHTLQIIDAAMKNKVSRLICVHTTGIFSKFRAASEEYLLIEKKIQELIRNTSIKMTILRPTMIYGDLCDRNMSKFIKMLDRCRVFPVIDNGKGLIQPVNARDLGKAYYNVLMMPIDKVKPEYNLSGEKPITLLEAFNHICVNLGKKTKFISVPLGVGVFLAIFFKTVSFGKYDYVEKIQRMSEDRSFSHEDARRDFGFTPISFTEGISREVGEYLNNRL